MGGFPLPILCCRSRSHVVFADNLWNKRCNAYTKEERKGWRTLAKWRTNKVTEETLFHSVWFVVTTPSTWRTIKVKKIIINLGMFCFFSSSLRLRVTTCLEGCRHKSNSLCHWMLSDEVTPLIWKHYLSVLSSFLGTILFSWSIFR